MSEPRIAYFATEFPRATDTFIQREVQALRNLGLDVETHAARRPGDEHMVGDEQRAMRDATSYVLPPSPLGLVQAHLGLLVRSPKRYVDALRLALDTKRPGLRGGLYQLFYFLEAGVLAQRLIGGKRTHVHSHFGDVSSSIAMLAGALANLPFSFTLHGPGVFFEAHTWRLDAKIERATFVSCISWFCRSQAQLLSSEEAADKLHIIHCGVDPERYRASAESRFNAPESDPTAPIRLAFAARLDHVKGLTILLDAMAQVNRDRRAAGLPEVHLEVAGDGPKRADFESHARKVGLADAVQFLGYVSQADVADLLARSDIYVLPSFAEGVPVSLMEPQASGIPVIATQVGGVSELVIDGETGFVVPPGDVDALATCIQKLADDRTLRTQLGTAGRKIVVEHFNSEEEARRLAALFRAAGSGAPTGSIAVRPEPAALRPTSR